MRLKDVVVGEKYEFQKWSGYPRYRVTVIEVGVHVPYYDFKGALIERENGRRSSTAARCLIRPWAEAEAQHKNQVEKTAEKRVILDRLHDSGIKIEHSLSRADINATLSIYETGKPVLIVKFTEPAEAEKLVKLLGSAE